MKNKFLAFGLTLMSLFSASLAQAAQGDYAPQTGLRLTGITIDCTNTADPTCKSSGLTDGIEFNLFTDNSAAADLRYQYGDSAYEDERDFTTAMKGEGIDTWGSGVTFDRIYSDNYNYEHTLSGLAVDDYFNVQIYIHNNANSTDSLDLDASSVEVSLDWSNPQSIQGSINYPGTEVSSPTTDIVTINLPDGVTIEPMDLPVWYFVNQIPYTVQSLGDMGTSGSSKTVTLSEVEACQNGVTAVHFPFKVVNDGGSDPELTIEKTSNNSGQAERGQEIEYTLTAENTGDVDLEDVQIVDEIDTDLFDYVRTEDSGGTDLGISLDTSDQVVIEVGDLAVGESASYNIFVKVKTDLSKMVDEVCNVGSVEASDGTSDETEICYELDPNNPYFEIEKTSDPVAGTAIEIGDEITYTLTAKNTGETDLTNVVITDVLDSNLEFKEAGSGGFTVSADGQTITIDFGTLAANSEVSQEIIVTVVNAEMDEVCNVATGTSDQGDSEESDEICHPVEEGGSRLDVEKTSDVSLSDPIDIGDEVEYTITVTNTHSSVDLTNVLVTDVLDSHVSWVSSEDGLTYDDSTRTVSTTISTLTAGETKTFKFTVMVEEGVMNSLCNTVSAEDDDGNEDDDEVCDDVVSGDPILEVEKNVSATGEVQIGDNITYTLTVSNNHPTEALTNVELTDTLPDGLSWVSQDATNNPQLTHDNGIITVTIPTLSVGESKTFNYDVQVEDAIMDDSCNLVSVEDDDGHEDDDEVCVDPPLDEDAFELEKTADPASGSEVVAGQEITYYLRVKNTSGGNLTNVVVTDTLNMYLEYVSSPDSVTVNGQTLTFDAGDFAPNEEKTFSFIARVSDDVPDGATIRNFFTAESDEVEEENSNTTNHTTPEDGSGGGGVSITPTFGVCYVEEVAGRDPVYSCRLEMAIDATLYTSCILEGRTEMECAELLTEQLDGRIPCDVDATSLTSPSIDDYCAPVVEIPDCVYCPDCLSGQSIEKVILDESSGQFEKETTIRDGEVATYKLTATLGDPSSIESAAEQFTILDGKIKFYDFTIPAESGGVFERHGITANINNQLVEAGWNTGGRFFEITLGVDQIALLNSAVPIAVEIQYQMNTELFSEYDITEYISNVAFAVVEYTYKYKTYTGIEGAGVANVLLTTDVVEIASDGSCDISNIPASAFTGDKGSWSTLGDIAEVRILRPFIQASAGANLGINLDGGQVIGTMGGETVSGRVFVREETLDAVNTVNEDLYEQQIDFANMDFSGDTVFVKLKVYAEKVVEFFEVDCLGLPDDSGLFFFDGDLEINGQLELDKSSTFVVDGNLTITDDFTVANNEFVSFVISGDLIIESDVTRMDGLFIVDGEIKSSGLSNVKLEISGGIMGNSGDLLQNRIFIGDDPDEKLEPSILINYDLRLLENTPAYLEEFLGEDWKQSQ